MVRTRRIFGMSDAGHLVVVDTAEMRSTSSVLCSIFTLFNVLYGKDVGFSRRSLRATSSTTFAPAEGLLHPVVVHDVLVFARAGGPQTANRLQYVGMAQAMHARSASTMMQEGDPFTVHQPVRQTMSARRAHGWWGENFTHRDLLELGRYRSITGPTADQASSAAGQRAGCGLDRRHCGVGARHDRRQAHNGILRPVGSPQVAARPEVSIFPRTPKGTSLCDGMRGGLTLPFI